MHFPDVGFTSLPNQFDLFLPLGGAAAFFIR